MIFIDNGTFTAPLDAPYAKELEAAFWRKGDFNYYTQDIQRVLPVAQYLAPSLAALLLPDDDEDGYDESMALEPRGDFEIPVPDNGETVYPFQFAAAEYCLRRESSLLAEDAGMGKSAIMALVANTMNAGAVLIVCPAIAKYNWYKKEWPKWTTLTHLNVGVAEGGYWPDADVVIINYDVLQRHKQKLQEKVWDLVIVDESHRIKNRDAKRTKMVLGGTIKLKNASDEDVAVLCAERGRKKDYLKVPAIMYKKRIFATATPMNRPKDLWTMAEACDPNRL